MLVEILFMVGVSIICNAIRRDGFYNVILEKNKSAIFSWVSVKEKIAYLVTKTVKEMPSFSFGALKCKVDKIEKEKQKKCKLSETLYYDLLLLCMYALTIIGNIFFDIILIVTIISYKEIINWKTLWNHVKNMVLNIPIKDVFNTVNDITKWLQNNVNEILVIVVIFLAIYVKILKRKKRKYLMEEIWAEEDKHRIKEIAKIQKNIETELFEIRKNVYENLKVIQEQISYYSKNKKIEFNHLVDYGRNTDIVKNYMDQIVYSGGTQIYVARNMKMYIQLLMLGLWPELSSETINICSKKYIEKNCKTKHDLYETYAVGVTIINGINRILKFSYRKRKQHNRITFKMMDVSYTNKVIDKFMK